MTSRVSSTVPDFARQSIERQLARHAAAVAPCPNRTRTCGGDHCPHYTCSTAGGQYCDACSDD